MFKKLKQAATELAIALAPGSAPPAQQPTVPRAERQISHRGDFKMQYRNGRISMVESYDDQDYEYMPNTEVTPEQFAKALTSNEACDQLVGGARREQPVLREQAKPAYPKGRVVCEHVWLDVTNFTLSVPMEQCGKCGKRRVSSTRVQPGVSAETYVAREAIERLEIENARLRREKEALLYARDSRDRTPIEPKKPEPKPDNRPDRSIIVEE